LLCFWNYITKVAAGCDVKFRGQATQVAFVRVAEGFSPAGAPIARKNTSHPHSRTNLLIA
jgi:hypothetical protein